MKLKIEKASLVVKEYCLFSFFFPKRVLPFGTIVIWGEGK